MLRGASDAARRRTLHPSPAGVFHWVLLSTAGVQLRIVDVPLLPAMLHARWLNLETHNTCEVCLNVLVVEDSEPGVIMDKVLLDATLLQARKASETL